MATAPQVLPPPVTGRARAIAPQVALIVLATSFQALVAGGFGLLLPLIRDDLGLTFTEAGSLAAAATLTYALMQVPSGMLADRFGPRRSFAIGSVGTNLLFLVFAATTTYLAAIAVQALSGVTRALAFAPGLVLTSTWFEPRRRATAIGLFLAGSQGWTILFGVVAPVLAAAAGWRTAMVAIGAIGLLFALAFAVFGRTGGAAATTDGSGTVAARPLGDLVRRPVIWLVGFAQFTRLAVVLGVGTWLPTYLIEEHGQPLALAGAVLAFTAVMTAPANLLGGWSADRWGRSYVVIGSAFAILAGALVLIAGGGLLGIGIGVILFACFQQFHFAPMFAAPIGLIGASSAGTVSGIGNLFANIGGFVAVLMLGAVKDASGSLAIGFLGLAVLCGFAVLATWRLQVVASSVPEWQPG